MRLGFVGIGLMGRPMTLRLLAAGHEVTVWNRSRDKLAAVVEKGARPADSPAAVARAAEIVMTCVTDQHAAEEVLFGRDGVIHGAQKGRLVDAPVSGGVAGAEKGTLAIMAGGKPEHVERARPAVMHLAQRFTRMGDSGAGQTTKLCNQIIVGSLIAVIAEAVRLAEAAGVDASMLPEALKGGFADSLPLQVFGARMAARTFEPSIGAVSIMLKDLENAAAVAKEKTVPLPMARTAAELYRLLTAQGRGEKEISVLVELLSGR